MISYYWSWWDGVKFFFTNRTQAYYDYRIMERILQDVIDNGSNSEEEGAAINEMRGLWYQTTPFEQKRLTTDPFIYSLEDFYV